MGANELSEHVDVMISEETAPVDAAEVLCAAMDEGCRCVHVAPSLAPAVRTAARGRCHVAVSCSQVLGWPGNSLLMHAGLMLSKTGADELDIPVEPSLLGDEAWLAGQLRRVTQLCHAHGALPIQVFNPNEDPTRLLSLGASSVRISAVPYNTDTLAA